RELPDVFSRMGWVFKNLGHLVRMNHMHVLGTGHIPYIGPVLLATNCRDETSCRHVISATDRGVRFIRSRLSETELAEAVAEARSGTIIALTADMLDLLPEVQSR